MIGILDCNNFFVSCERLFRPDLSRRPVAVLSSNDGCIVARSQEIKDLGIPMGVPYFQVKDICTKASAVLFSSNFTLYRDVSARVMTALKDEVGECEVYSIDEAFFTLPENITEAELLALRHRIIQVTGIPVSIGAGASKTIAKQANKVAKKGIGVAIMTPERWQEHQEEVACSEVWGIGRRLSERLRALKVVTVAELLALPKSVIEKEFGIGGVRIVDELRGQAVYQVTPTNLEPKQSITSSRSFAKVVTDQFLLESAIAFHIARVGEKLRQEGLVAARMVVLIRPSRFSDWAGTPGVKEIIFSEPTASTSLMTKQALKAVQELYQVDVPYKKAGVILSGLLPEVYASSSLFSTKETERDRTLDTLSDTLNQKFGHSFIRLAAELPSGAQSSALLRSPQYTTSWSDIPRVQAK